MVKISRKGFHLSWHVCLGTLLIALMFALAGGAFADTNDTPMGDFLCNVGNWCTGNLGKGLAVGAVIIVGIGALLNKVSWSMTLTVMLNISVIFGAVTIVDALGASPTVTCATNVAGVNGQAHSVWSGSPPPSSPTPMSPANMY